jgi:hypothetical protein
MEEKCRFDTEIYNSVTRYDLETTFICIDLDWGARRLSGTA